MMIIMRVHVGQTPRRSVIVTAQAVRTAGVLRSTIRRLHPNDLCFPDSTRHGRDPGSSAGEHGTGLVATGRSDAVWHMYQPVADASAGHHPLSTEE
jgi:hypothetical protein